MLLYADAGSSLTTFTPGLVVFIEKVHRSDELVCHGQRPVMIPLTMFAEFHQFNPQWLAPDSSDGWLKENVALKGALFDRTDGTYSRHVALEDYHPLQNPSGGSLGSMENSSSPVSSESLKGLFVGLGRDPFRVYLELHGMTNVGKCWESHLKNFSKKELQLLSEFRDNLNSDLTIHSESQRSHHSTVVDNQEESKTEKKDGHAPD